MTSARYFESGGHDVTVIDRRIRPGARNQRGECRTNYRDMRRPRAALGVPLKAIKWMFQRHAPPAVRLMAPHFN
ncbi:hypothetical protein KCP74_16850 [Salmonella enterica subsp. enterica]|nr:hypothetical protein KCP74_16850 [Salmonella enterica subsp. enterica]